MIENLKPYEQEVILYLQSELILVLMKHLVKAEGCIRDDEKKALPFPSIDFERVKSLGLTVQDINIAFMVLNNQNKEECYKKSSQELAYARSVLDNALHEYTNNSLPEKLKHMTYLLFPSAETIKFLIVYNKLSPEKKSYFLKLIGKKTYKSKLFLSLGELKAYQEH